jgi:hypothetical protein
MTLAALFECWTVMSKRCLATDALHQSDGRPGRRRGGGRMSAGTDALNIEPGLGASAQSSGVRLPAAAITVNTARLGYSLVLVVRARCTVTSRYARAD